MLSDVLLREFSDGGCAGVSGDWLTRKRERAREVRAAVYLLVVLTVGAYLPTPLYPGYQQTFGFSDLTMTLIFATFALVTAPALLFFGPAADALGRRVVLRASVIAAALASGCFALAAGPEWLFVGRATQGVALGAATAAATALIAERAPDGNRSRASVVASMAFVGGTAAGPLVAGVLAEYAPLPLLLPYLAHLVLLGIGWLCVSALPASGARASRWRPTRPHVPAGMRLRLGTAAAVGFLAWTVAGLFLAVIPAVLGRAAQIGNLALTGGIVAAVLACSVLVLPLIPRCGPGTAQFVGLGALLGSLIALTLTGGSSLPVTMAAAIAAGVGHGLAYGGTVATIDTTAPNGQRASINGAVYLVFYLGTGVPTVAVGLLTLELPLTTAISWISATAAALVPLVGAALAHANRTPGTEFGDGFRGRFHARRDAGSAMLHGRRIARSGSPAVPAARESGHCRANSGQAVRSDETADSVPGGR